MKIAPASLKDYISDTDPVILRDEHGAMLRYLDRNEALALADKRAIYGKAHNGTLRHVLMNGVNEQEVSNILSAPRARRVSLVSEASRTVRRERVVVIAPRRMLLDKTFTQSGTFTIFQHDTNFGREAFA